MTQEEQAAAAVERMTTQLPQDYQADLLHKVCKEIDDQGLLGCWLYFTEIAEVACRSGIISRNQAEDFGSVLKFPFYMLDTPSGPLFIRLYAIEQRDRNKVGGWFRFRYGVSLFEERWGDQPAFGTNLITLGRQPPEERLADFRKEFPLPEAIEVPG